MATYEVVLSLNKIVKAIEQADALTGLFNALSPERPHIFQQLGEIAQDKGTHPTSANVIWDRFQTMIGPIRNVDLAALLESIRLLSEVLKEAGKDLSPTDECAVSIKFVLGNLDLLLKEYITYITHQNRKDMVPLFYRAIHFQSQLTLLQQFAADISDELTRDPELGEGEAFLELFIDSGNSLEETIRRLEALLKLYQQVAFLADSSTPPHIARLEVGSLDIKIRGDGKVIGLIEKILDKVGGYFYRRFTEEGRRRAGIQIGKEEIRDLLELKKELEAADLPTDKLDANIDECTAITSGEIAKLLGEARSVAVNGRIYDMNVPDQKQLAAPAKQIAHKPATDAPIEK